MISLTSARQLAIELERQRRLRQLAEQADKLAQLVNTAKKQG